MQNLANFLFEHRAKNVEPSWLAQVLGRLVWLAEDNGSSIHQTLEEWLAGDDIEKIKVALAYDESLIFVTHKQAVEVYSSLATRFPMLQASINNALSRWESSSHGT